MSSAFGSNRSEPNRSFVCLRPNPNAVLRLFCFPYAGGSAQVFQSWPGKFGPSVEVWSLQLPGRGRRMREAAFLSAESAVEQIIQDFTLYEDKPFAFFGHSMGALLSFEVARALRREQMTGPTQLFVSGCRAPQLPHCDKATYNLPEPELIEEIRRLNGTPQEVLNNAELMQLLLPILRADLTLCQTYTYQLEPPLSCPISAFCGLQDDEVGQKGIDGWRQQTASSFSVSMLPGDHFFLHTSEHLLLQIISRELQLLLIKARA